MLRLQCWHIPLIMEQVLLSLQVGLLLRVLKCLCHSTTQPLFMVLTTTIAERHHTTITEYQMTFADGTTKLSAESAISPLVKLSNQHC